MTTINLCYQITNHGITLSLDDQHLDTTRYGQFVVPTVQWHEPKVTLKIYPNKGTLEADTITLLIMNSNNAIVPSVLPQEAGVSEFSYIFKRAEGVNLTVTISEQRLPSTTRTIYLIPGGTCDLAKLPPPKNPESGKPSTTTPKGPGGIRFPEPDRIPKAELKNSGSKLNAELDDLRKSPPR